MTEKFWFTVDPSSFRVSQPREMGSITAVSSTSPYSIPEIVTYYPNLNGVRAFEFQYIGPEEPTVSHEYNNLHFSTGKNSKRLFRISTSSDLSSTSLDDFRKGIAEAVAKKVTAIANSGIAEAVIVESKNKIEEAQRNQTTINGSMLGLRSQLR